MEESPDPGTTNRLLELFAGDATMAPARMLVAARGRAQGWVVLDLGLQEAGSARELAQVHAAIALQALRDGRPSAPTLILSAGEVVANQESSAAAQYLLALALASDEHPCLYAAAVGAAMTGAGELPKGAQAFSLEPFSLARARRAQCDPAACLTQERADEFFCALNACSPSALSLHGNEVLRAILLIAN
jgi:glycerate 2-kinase